MYILKNIWQQILQYLLNNDFLQMNFELQDRSIQFLLIMNQFQQFFQFGLQMQAQIESALKISERANKLLEQIKIFYKMLQNSNMKKSVEMVVQIFQQINKIKIVIKQSLQDQKMEYIAENTKHKIKQHKIKKLIKQINIIHNFLLINNQNQELTCDFDSIFKDNYSLIQQNTINQSYSNILNPQINMYFFGQIFLILQSIKHECYLLLGDTYAQIPFFNKLFLNNVQQFHSKISSKSNKRLLKNENEHNSLKCLMVNSQINQPILNDYLPCNMMKRKPRNKIFPDSKSMDIKLISEMSIQMLFLIFYLQKNTFEQYFAAKILMTKIWRFDTKFYFWFKRIQEPTIQTDEFQQGNYFYFDFQKFSIKKKSNLLIKYSQLEKFI